MKTGRIYTMVVAAGSTALAACQADITEPREDRNHMPLIADSSAEGSAALAGRVIAMVPSGNGGSLTFVDEGDGVSVGEVAPRTEAFVSRQLIEGLRATPLEVYLAVKPGRAGAPASLVRDHRGRAGALAEPRALSLAGPGALGLNTPGIEPYDCSAFAGGWNDDWKAAFIGVTKYQATVSFHPMSGAFVFYPGSNVYYGTNTNSKTYLGACNQDFGTSLKVEIHRKVNGSWNTVHQVNLLDNTKYTFYSGLPAYYRGRASVAPGHWVSSSGLGAAWTISPGLSQGF